MVSANTVCTNKTVSRTRLRGFTLVELMVGLILASLVLIVILRIFASSREQYQTHEAMARLQENIRQAQQFLAEDVRMAGFTGPIQQYWMIVETGNNAHKLGTVTGECFNTVTHSFRWSAPVIAGAAIGANDPIPPRLFGEDDTLSLFATRSSDGCINPSNHVSNTDVLSVHYAGAPWSAGGTQSTSRVPNANIGNRDEMFYIRGNARGGVVFSCGMGGMGVAVGSGGNNCLNQSVGMAGMLTPSSLSTDLFNSVAAPDPAAKAETANYGLQAIAYYIRPCSDPGSNKVCGDANDDTIPVLVRARMEYNTSLCPDLTNPCVVHEPVAEGVASMQVQYGVDSTPLDAIDSVDQYKTAAQLNTGFTVATAAADYAAWSQVRTVRIWLLFRSLVIEPGYVERNVDSSGKYNVAGEQVDVIPGYRYQLTTTTLNLRNTWISR